MNDLQDLKKFLAGKRKRKKEKEKSWQPCKKGFTRVVVCVKIVARSSLIWYIIWV